MNRSGFTLIEMSIVLIIMGLIVGSGTKLFVSFAKNTKIKETKDQLTVLTKDIEGFSKLFHRLPTRKELKNFYMKTTDSWGKEIVYIPSSSLLKNVCSVNKTNLTHIQGKKRITNLAFMLVSSGPNRNLQSSVENQIIKTASYGELIDFNEEQTYRKQAYDDIYMSQTLWSLHAQIQCAPGEK